MRCASDGPCVAPKNTESRVRVQPREIVLGGMPVELRKGWAAAESLTLTQKSGRTFDQSGSRITALLKLRSPPAAPAAQTVQQKLLPASRHVRQRYPIPTPILVW